MTETHSPTVALTQLEEPVEIYTKALPNTHLDAENSHWRLYADEHGLPTPIHVQPGNYERLDAKRFLTAQAYDTAEDAAAALAEMAADRTTDPDLPAAARRVDALLLIGSPIDRDELLDRYYASLI